MSIGMQWLIFGGIGVAMFIVGLLAKNSEKTAKEEHPVPKTTPTAIEMSHDRPKDHAFANH